MRILVVSPEIPFPPVGGGQLRTYHLVRALATRHDVTFVGFTYDSTPESAPFPLQVVCVPWEWPDLYRQMYYGDAISSQRASERLANKIDEPWFVSCLQSPPMEETLRRVARDGFDLALIEHTNMARFLPALPRNTPKVLDLVDVHTLMAQRTAESKSGNEKVEASREADRTLRFERAVASQCTLCLTCSGLEAFAVRRWLGTENVLAIPNGVDTSFFAPTEDRPTSGYLLFTGRMDYEPNIESVQYFGTEMLPLIRREIPEAKLHIVGANPTAEVNRLISESVTVHGYVPDMRPYFRSAEVVVVPLLCGGGTRVKVLEAAASGKAIVSTPLGVEGLEFSHGEDLVVAQSGSDFAGAVIALARDQARRRQLGRRARQASLQYDWDTIGTRLCALLESLV